jgi:PAS domain S-box-containing protein
VSAQIVSDADGRVVSWDTEAERILGFTADEVVGRLLAETIVPARYLAQHDAGIASLRATGAAPVLGKRLQVAALRKDGTEIPVDLRITQLSAKPPTFLGLIDPRTPPVVDDLYTATDHRTFVEASQAEHAQRAGRLADQTDREATMAASDVEDERVRRARDLAARTARGVASAASDIEDARIQRATDLAVEARDSKRQAGEVAKQVGEMAIEVGHLRRAAERMESDIKDICKKLDISEDMQRSYGLEQSSPRERAWFPGMLQWFGTMLKNVADSGKTGIDLMNEVVEQRADRLHMSKTGLLIIAALAPFLVALFSIVIARLVGGGH